jgi:hypothetical protein
VVRRLAWLTALALLASCGGDPAPEVENPATVKRKKKKKKKKKQTDVADAAEDAPKKKKKSEDPEEKRRQQEEEDAREAEERRERIRKREAEEAKEQEEKEAVASDDGGDSSEDEDAKAEEKKAKAEEKKRKKEEAAEEAKRKKEEAAEKKRVAAEEKKAAAEAKKEAEAEKKKKKKNKEEVEEESSDEEEVASNEDEEEETKKDDKKSKKDKKAKKTVAAKETTKKDSKKKKEEAEEEEEKESEKEKEKEPEKEVAEADIDMEDEGSGLPPPDPENESKELDLEGGTPQRDTDDVEVAPPMLAIDRRPLTQPKGKFDVHGGLRVAAITTTGAMGASSTATSEGLGLGATYGVSNKIQVGFDYTIGINPGSAKGPLALSGAFRVKESEKLDIALSAGFAVDFITTTDPMTMMTTDVTLKALQFGIWTRYHLGAKASVFTGLPALPNASGGLSGAAGLPPLPYHLSLGLGQGATIALEVPVGFGYQASPKLYAMAMTSLAHIDMKNSTGAFLFADYIPFTVGGFYAKDAKLDIGAVLSDDVKQGLGYLRFDIVARYYLK